MNLFWKAFYNAAFIPLFYVLIKTASLFSRKIRRGLRERKNLFHTLEEQIKTLDRAKKNVWVHSSSLGEFEQAKPIIEKLKANYKLNIIATFFSPSGYDNSRKYHFADIVGYLPFDAISNAKKFLSIIKPDIALIMRYDIWPNFIWKLGETNIPCLLVDATMRKKSKRKIFGIRNMHKYIYSYISKILTVSAEDAESFKHFNIPEDKIAQTGDTRFDRVYQQSLIAKEKKLFKDGFFDNKKIAVFGSTWEADEEVIFPAFKKISEIDDSIILIIAPHEPTIERLERIENEFKNGIKSIRFSYLNNYENERVIIIDSIGILRTLYFYADIAYVGGSFKQGVHSVLEPAVYGIPVLFGPKINNSQEALKLLELGGGFKVCDKRAAFKIMRKLFSDNEFRKKAGTVCRDFVNRNIGATDKIVSEISKRINMEVI